MVVMDRPRRLPDGRITAHLLSDLHGDAAYRELLPVALALGCHPAFYQYPDRYKAHFDLIGSHRINAALVHPAIETVPRRRIAEILRRRKHLEEGV